MIKKEAELKANDKVIVRLKSKDGRSATGVILTTFNKGGADAVVVGIGSKGPQMFVKMNGGWKKPKKDVVSVNGPTYSIEKVEEQQA